MSEPEPRTEERRTWKDRRAYDRRQSDDAGRSGGSDSNGLRVDGPGGWGVSITGRDVILVVLLVALGAIVWLGLRDLATIVSAAAQARSAEHEQLAKSDRDLLCLLGLQQDDRADAVMSGDVCRWLLTTYRREPGAPTTRVQPRAR